MRLIKKQAVDYKPIIELQDNKLVMRDGHRAARKTAIPDRTSAPIDDKLSTTTLPMTPAQLLACCHPNSIMSAQFIRTAVNSTQTVHIYT